MKTLYISDLDGTLLTSEERVSPYSMRVLNAMIDNGMLFTYATARSFNSAAKAVWGLRQNLPVRLYNGALIVEPKSGEMLYNNHFNRGQSEYIKSLVSRYELSPLAYSFQNGKECVSWVEGSETAGMLRYLERRKSDARLHPVRCEQELYLGDLFYITCIDEKRRLDGLQVDVQASLDLKTIYEQEMYQTYWWCEIMPAATSKGNAARFLKDYLRADRLVAFGDGINDFSLFEAANESYAVKNACEGLKVAASGVIGFSEEDGVAKFLQTLKK